MWTVDVSIKVMWKYIEKRMKKDEFVLWWKEKHGDSIREQEPEKWDISSLCRAITQCKKITGDTILKHKPPDICQPTDEVHAVCCLKDLRNDLFHKSPLEISEKEYRDKVALTKQCYTKLLENDSEVEHFRKELEDINRK